MTLPSSGARLADEELSRRVSRDAETAIAKGELETHRRAAYLMGLLHDIRS